MNAREKRLFALTAILLVILVVKSMWWDIRLPELTQQEEQFVNAIEVVIDKDYKGIWLYRWGVLRLAIIDVTPASENVLLDLEREGVAAVYPYIAKVRRYLFQIIPIADFKMMK
jgi:hypothetical protein